ncbi:MAG TPA: histidine phosphatase family protein, partial [Trueperaceae bacterium]|nr:histidine phosphatase family protein [Trueperaceae bacterium]
YLPAVSDTLVTGTVVASHEPKAVATARELARVWGRSFGQASGLEEHHRGPLPIVDDFTWRATVGRLFTSPATLVFGEETGAEALQRFATGVDSVLATAQSRGDRLTTIVSHGTVMTLYLATANHLDSIEFWSSLAMPEALLVRSRDRRLMARVGADGELRRPGNSHHQ